MVELVDTLEFHVEAALNSLDGPDDRVIVIARDLAAVQGMWGRYSIVVHPFNRVSFRTVDDVLKHNRLWLPYKHQKTEAFIIMGNIQPPIAEKVVERLKSRSTTRSSKKLIKVLGANLSPQNSIIDRATM